MRYLAYCCSNTCENNYLKEKHPEYQQLINEKLELGAHMKEERKVYNKKLEKIRYKAKNSGFSHDLGAPKLNITNINTIDCPECGFALYWKKLS